MGLRVVKCACPPSRTGNPDVYHAWFGRRELGYFQKQEAKHVGGGP